LDQEPEKKTPVSLFSEMLAQLIVKRVFEQQAADAENKPAEKEALRSARLRNTKGKQDDGPKD
jgi:hypothetical protein